MGDSAPIIQGLDLKIDNSVHELCKVSNETSSHTRGILYFIMLITLLSFIAVLNTHKINWIGSRIELAKKDVKTKIRNGEEYDTARVKYESLVRSKVENYSVVRLPVLGIAFDINNLSLVSGFALTFLLIVLRFTINREYINLKIAFNSIIGRYPDNANWSDFEKSFPLGQDTPGEGAKNGNQPTATTTEKDEWLKQINRKRREHHYNYLSMNEVFNMPPSKSKLYDSGFLKWFRNFVSKSLFALPLLSYVIIAINDYFTFEKGWMVNPIHTGFNWVLTSLFLLAILYLTFKNIVNEQRITVEYEKFYKENCSMEKDSDRAESSGTENTKVVAKT